MISRRPDISPDPGAKRGRSPPSPPGSANIRPAPHEVSMDRPPHPVAISDDRWATRLVCSRTGEALPLDRPAFLSAAGAPLLVEYDLDPARGERLRQALPG